MEMISIFTFLKYLFFYPPSFPTNSHAWVQVLQQIKVTSNHQTGIRTRDPFSYQPRQIKTGP